MHRTPERTRLRIVGADGRALAARIGAHPDVHSARWSDATSSLTVEHRRGLTLAELAEGTPNHPVPDEGRGDAEQRSASTPGLARQLLVPALALGAGLAGATPFSAPLIAICAVPMARRALTAVRGRRLSIDVLDTAAAGILLGTGDVLAAGVSVGLIEVGERIRRRAAGQARRVLRGSLSGETRVRVVRDGTEPRVPAGDLVPGERAVVYAGEVIPIDGVVISGAGAVDNQAWTGEPSPKRVEVDDSVLAGATVVDGRLVIAVTAAGDDTRGGRLAAAIDEAISSSTQVSDLAQRLADRFVLPVLGIAGATFLLTGDISRLASMLIVDFGTGIRVSVPTAILTTMVAGARRDILFRTGKSVERLAHVDTVVFDKTGTLTSGRPTVVGIDVVGDMDAAAALRLAAAAEGHLPHPLARAVRSAARRRGLQPPEPEAVRYIAGGGVLATIEGHEVVVGDARLLTGQGVILEALDSPASSRVWIAVDGRAVAVLRLRDTVRPESREALERLRAMRIHELWLATGDREGAARSVARGLGISNVRSRMMPEDKIELVRELRARGRCVALVGDGINDAAAMAEADVGIAVASGAELARQAAEIVVGDISALPEALDLARSAMGIVRENVAVVSTANGGALALATAGLLPPLAATLVNNGSTVAVATNALRPLRRPREGRAGG